MKIVLSAIGILFGTLYLLIALFMALFIGLMAHGGFILLMKYFGVE
tara:strand:+ start:4099 stop:4236 length:138 start_codon:yes stop_codon:yes gene_type:complete